MNIKMGVDRILYGMVGLSLPYNKQTGERIRTGLYISDEDWSNKYSSHIEEYFDERDLGYWSYEKPGSYHAVLDGMSGNYFVVGKIIFDMEIDEFSDDDFKTIDTEQIDYSEVQDKLLELFGLDVGQDEIQTIVFVHYT